MTAATPSPVHFTSSVASARGVLTLFRMPDAPPAGQAIGNGLYGTSAPVRTRTTPGIAFAAGRVDRADVGVGVGAAQDGHVGHPGHLDVVEVAALAGDEPGILDPLDPGPHDVEVIGLASCQAFARGRHVGAGAQGRGRLADRRHDVLVAGAAADVALDRVADLVVGRVRVAASRSAAAMIIPGVQNPHWRPCFSQKAVWSAWSPLVRGHALDRRDARGRRPGRPGPCTT